MKYHQAMLQNFSATASAPQIAIHKTNAVVTSDCHVHFYGWSKDRWTLTTTVSLQNAHHLSAALSYGTAVVLGAAHNNI